MPDRRRHRGPDPEDPIAFSPAALPALRAAVAELDWLLERGYAPVSALKLVGDRHALTGRQRAAVARCACSASRVEARRSRLVPPASVRGEPVAIDAFNVLTTIEVALAGGVVLVGADGALRDIAGVHGTHRLVEETVPAVELLGRYLEGLGTGACTFLFDRPVSNSGRLSVCVNELAARRGWPFESRVEDDPDRQLRTSAAIVASADGAILDAGVRWCNLARECVARAVPSARLVDLS